MKLKGLILFVVVALCSCSPRPEGFTINGTVYGLSGKIYLEEINDYGYPARIDTATIENGKFNFSGILSEPSACYIVDFPRGKRVLTTVVLDNKTDIDIELTANENGGVNISHSKASEDSIREKFQQQLSQKESYEQKLELLGDLILENPSSIYSAYAVFTSYSAYDKIPKARELALQLKGPAAESKYTKIVLDRAAKIEKVAVGQKFTDFSSALIGGQPIALSKFAGEGKWTFLYFCNCYANSYHYAKYVVGAHKKYMNKGAGIEMFVHTSDYLQSAMYKTMEDIYEIGDNAKLWYFTSDLEGMKGEVFNQYGIINMPYGILISPDGTITEHIDTYQLPEIESIWAKHIK